MFEVRVRNESLIVNFKTVREYRIWGGYYPNTASKKTTICTLAWKKHNGEIRQLSTGMAFCSVKDVYNRTKGRKIALARALSAARFSKETRAEFWAYLLRRYVL